ncbi:major facilitator superfamily domain-containing protein SP1173 [Lycorma delicatula]|uniref:major facilitator superfamily domain-containing protein SP1173 n=1 Tax=Lycorma delicatula TaxID=130591 RepID=UPI003F5136CE
MTQEKNDNNVGLSFLSLKCVLFLFFGGLGCILAFLPLHMRDIGLTGNEGRIVSIVAPCIAIIGPMLVGPLSDRWGAGATQYSRHMRGLLSTFLLVGAIAYTSLLFVPKVSRLQQRNPAVNFLCTSDSGYVLQEKCEDSECYDWPDDNFGSLFLSHCNYSCSYNVTEPPSVAGALYSTKSPNYHDDVDIDNDEEAGSGSPVLEEEAESKNTYLGKPNNEDHSTKKTTKAKEAPPHLCLTSSSKTMCHVYTKFSEQLTINVSLLPSPATILYDTKWCRFPVSDKVSCHMPPGYQKCAVMCDLLDPYSRQNSLLVDAKCQKTIGDDQVTFWSYLILRSFADIFPVTVVALLDSCLITATRDTQVGIGSHLAIAALGIAIFPPVSLYSYMTVIDLLGISNPTVPLYAVPIITFAVLSVIAGIIVIFDKSMPLSPVDYWLHSNSGSFVVKGAGIETVAVTVVLVLLGTLWSTLDSYLPWHLLLELKGPELLVALTLTAGALPSIPFLCYSESIINYCGHSHLFITAFTFYIIRFTGLVYFVNPWWILICEALEVFTLGIMWATAMLYMKQLVSRHLTTSGQALAVIAHFCLGRSIGAVLGGVLSENDSLIPVYQISAVVAAVIASLYFIIYHCCIRPKCLRRSTATGYRNPHAPLQGTNANGTYTPLKVYNRRDQTNNNQQPNRY